MRHLGAPHLGNPGVPSSLLEFRPHRGQFFRRFRAPAYMRAFTQAWGHAEIVQQLAGQLPWFHRLLGLAQRRPGARHPQGRDPTRGDRSPHPSTDLLELWPRGLQNGRPTWIGWQHFVANTISQRPPQTRTPEHAAREKEKPGTVYASPFKTPRAMAPQYVHHPLILAQHDNSHLIFAQLL
jgi:hypothetical protein